MSRLTPIIRATTAMFGAGLLVAGLALTAHSAGANSKAISALALSPTGNEIAVGAFRSVTCSQLGHSHAALKSLQGCPGA